MPALAGFVLRRLVQMALTIVIVIAVNFLLLHAVPGDMVDVLAMESQVSDPAQLAQMRQDYGLDRSLPVQLLAYYSHVLQLDLGFSARLNAPVTTLILSRLPATLLLMASSVFVSFVVGALLGAAAARRHNSATDILVCLSAMLLYSTPSFLAGLLMILVFAVWLNWLPVTGFSTPGLDLDLVPYLVDVALHLAMPAVTLGLIFLAVYTRLMRATMLEILDLDYIRTARAKGIGARRVLFRHAVRNAMPPMVVMCGLQVSSLFGGTVVVETIYGWPGMGLLAYNAVFQRDFTLLLGLLLVSSVIVMVVGLVVDLLLMRLDPRVLPG